MTAFNDQLPSVNERFEMLPFFHTCDVFNARKNITNLSIPAPQCDVFGEDIAYLFYGRPAFKYALSKEADRKLSIYPVAFVVDGSYVSDIKRIFPFDTGAMANGLYARHFHPELTYLDFELAGDMSRIDDLVARFFKTNKKYLSFESESPVADAFDIESNELATLYSSLIREPADERRATIEIQAGSAVLLTKKSLLAIIIPEELSASLSVQRFVADTDAIIETYPSVVWNPELCFAQVAEAARRFISARFELDQ